MQNPTHLPVKAFLDALSLPFQPEATGEVELGLVDAMTTAILRYENLIQSSPILDDITPPPVPIQALSVIQIMRNLAPVFSTNMAEYVSKIEMHSGKAGLDSEQTAFLCRISKVVFFENGLLAAEIFSGEKAKAILAGRAALPTCNEWLATWN